MSERKSPRRRAREFIVQGLYQWQVGDQDAAAIQVQAEGVAGFDKADGALYSTLLVEARQNAEALTLDLAPHIDRAWDEVSPVERCILLLGACELKLHPETPYRVIINEAIELAKTFGGTDGHKFVNGVLDKLAPLLRPAEGNAAIAAERTGGARFDRLTLNGIICHGLRGTRGSTSSP